MLIGGLLPSLPLLETFSIAKPYYQDDLTWCIQKSKNFPWIINIFAAATPECWIGMIFGVGYVCGTVMYFMVQFDMKYKHRNKRDYHYMTWFVAMPALIGMNQHFQPKSITLRLFYGYVLIIMVFAWQTFFLLGFEYFKEPIQRAQKSTIDEIVDYDFRLAGSAEVLQIISFDERVNPLTNSF